MKSLSLAILCVACAGATQVDAAPAKPAKTSQVAPKAAVVSKSQDDIVIDAAKSGVLEKLKDPDSANFRNISIFTGDKPEKGTLYVCGEVNSKNSYGGYVGFTPFWSMVFSYPDQNAAISGFASILSDQENSGLVALMAQHCQGAPASS